MVLLVNPTDGVEGGVLLQNPMNGVGGRAGQEYFVLKYICT